MKNQILIEKLSVELKRAEFESGLDRKPFAEKLDISEAAFGRIKAGKYKVTRNMLEKICLALNWNEQDFIENSKSESQNGNDEKIEITENDKIEPAQVNVISESGKATPRNRDNLLIQLGRAQGEANAYKNSLEKQTLTLKDSMVYYFEKIDTTFNVLMDLVKEKKPEHTEQRELAPEEEATGKDTGTTQQKIKIVHPKRVLSHGERR
jgi:DNA-binding Xre family transcriptional regulator